MWAGTCCSPCVGNSGGPGCIGALLRGDVRRGRNDKPKARLVSMGNNARSERGNGAAMQLRQMETLPHWEFHGSLPSKD